MTEDEMYDIIRCYEDSERDYYERNIELEAENAKLRDFIAQIWPVVEHPARWCDECRYSGECIETDKDGVFVRFGCRWREDMRETARELRIEVDG